MFVRPRLSRLWILLAGGILLALFGWVVHRNSSTVSVNLSQTVATGIERESSLEFESNQLVHQVVSVKPPEHSILIKKSLISQNQSLVTLRQPSSSITTPIPLHHQENGTNHPQKSVPLHFQIHNRPLKYSTSELQAKLDALRSGHHTDLDSLIERQLHVCSKLETNHDNTSAYYRELIASSLEAWRDFMPPNRDMMSSHCWYTNSFRRLKPSLESKMSKWDSLYYIKKRYTRDEILATLNSVLGSKRKAAFHNSTQSLAGTNNFFCVPKVYLGGFPKCGTTALYSYLTSHPSIVEPYTKEGQFWREFVLAEDQDYRRFEVLLYLYHFKGAAHAMKYNTNKMMTLDASASTIFASTQRRLDIEKDSCTVPHLLSKVLPATKFIFIMRDPVERLWSDYWYFCSKDHFHSKVPKEVVNKASEIFHNHTVGVVEEFIDCISKGKSEFECTMIAHSDAGENSACRSARVGLSLYYFHVIRWLSVFPREQILFLTLEELKQNTYLVLEQIWRFLEVNPLPKRQIPDHVISNSNLWIKSEQYKDRFKMWPETRRLLSAFFVPTM